MPPKKQQIDTAWKTDVVLGCCCRLDSFSTETHKESVLCCSICMNFPHFWASPPVYPPLAVVLQCRAQHCLDSNANPPDISILTYLFPFSPSSSLAQLSEYTFENYQFYLTCNKCVTQLCFIQVFYTLLLGGPFAKEDHLEHLFHCVELAACRKLTQRENLIVGDRGGQFGWADKEKSAI